MNERSEMVRVLLPNGIEMWAEAQAVGSKEVEVSALGDLRTALSLDSLRGAIEGMGTLALDALAKVKPDEIAVEFGLELGVEHGQITALWVKGSGKASLKITLCWKGEKANNA